MKFIFSFLVLFVGVLVACAGYWFGIFGVVPFVVAMIVNEARIGEQNDYYFEKSSK